MSGVAGLAAALVERLQADSGVSALAGGGVMAAVRQSAAFPFVAVAGVAARAWNAGGEPGREAVVTLEAFSRDGRDAALVLAEACGGVLDGQSFDVEGGRVVGLFAEAADVALEKDRVTWRARVRVRALVEG
ncbi:MAG: DUF3168 domain-containing protein [Micropepsaceae bacterium]